MATMHWPWRTWRPTTISTAPVGLFSPDVHERYLELSRRPKATACLTDGMRRRSRSKRSARRSCRCVPRTTVRPTAPLPASASTGRRAGTRGRAGLETTIAKATSSWRRASTASRSSTGSSWSWRGRFWRQGGRWQVMDSKRKRLVVDDVEGA